MTDNIEPQISTISVVSAQEVVATQQETGVPSDVSTEETSTKTRAPSTVGLSMPARKSVIIRSLAKKINTSLYGERGLQKFFLKEKNPSQESSEAFLKLEEGLQALIAGCEALENLD